MPRLWAYYDYPNAYFMGPFAPREANPIYTSLATSRSYSGSRTKLTTYTDTGARPITLTTTVTESYSGSVPSWTWDRVYPSAYTHHGYGRDFTPDPATPTDPHEGYFSLAPSLHVRPPALDGGGFPEQYSVTDYFDPKKQALGFYAMGGPPYPDYLETVIIGTRTTVNTGLGVGNVPFSSTTTVNITAAKYPSGGNNLLGTDANLPRFITAPQIYSGSPPRFPVLTWGYDGGGGVRYGVDVTAWSATKWRDYRGSYSAVIPMPDGGTAWESSNVETTVNWTLG